MSKQVSVAIAIFLFPLCLLAEEAQTLKPLKAEASSALLGKDDAKPENAIDGDLKSSWKSEAGDEEQWFKVDLGSTRIVSGIDISWDFAHAKEFTVEVSQDGKGWTQVQEQRFGKGGREAFTFDPVQTRFVRVHLIKRAKPEGYAIEELGVKGK